MERAKWVVLAILLVSPGWMAFDGARALVVGDYVTPGRGPHAGQLGPWSEIVSAVGIPPHSTTMKWIFVAYGVATLATGFAFLTGVSRAWTVLVILAFAGLWYLPFGTLLHAVLLVVLFRRDVRPTDRALADDGLRGG